MTIKAEVKAIYTTDMDFLELHPPGDPEHFCVWVRAMVGPEGGEGEESFDIGVCTPKWLAKKCEQEGFVVGRHYLVVERYDPPRLRTLITELIEKCEGNSWQEVGEKVGRIGHWEFEDYKLAAQPE